VRPRPRFSPAPWCICPAAFAILASAAQVQRAELEPVKTKIAEPENGESVRNHLKMWPKVQTHINHSLPVKGRVPLGGCALAPR